MCHFGRLSAFYILFFKLKYYIFPNSFLFWVGIWYDWEGVWCFFGFDFGGSKAGKDEFWACGYGHLGGLWGGWDLDVLGGAYMRNAAFCMVSCRFAAKGTFEVDEFEV